jgi:Kef-type K+ transport system membrane component KefB
VDYLAFAGALVGLIVLAQLLGYLFAKSSQPRVVGEIAAGLLLGPSLLGVVAPDFTQYLFNSISDAKWIKSSFADLGLAMLMLGAGLEVHVARRGGDRRLVTFLAVIGVVVPVVASVPLLSLLDFEAMLGSSNNSLAFTLVFAAAVAVTSIPVISRILLDLGLGATRFARVVLSVAVIDDLLLYVVIAIALGLVVPSGSEGHGLPIEGGSSLFVLVAPLAHVALSLIVMLGFRYLPSAIARVAGWQDDAFSKRQTWIALQVVLLAILLPVSWQTGVNPMFPALAAGVGCAGLLPHSAMSTNKLSIASTFFGRAAVTLYFALVGLKLDLAQHFDPLNFVTMLAGATAIKAAAVWIAARSAGEPASSAFHFAAALNARGGPGIVLAVVSYDAGIISPMFFTTLVLLAIVTSQIAGAVLAQAVRRGAQFEESPEPLHPSPPTTVLAP